MLDRRSLLLFGLAAVSSGFVAGCSAADLVSQPGNGPVSWPAATPNSTVTVDHRAWEVFLSRHAFDRGDGVTLVAYADVPMVDRELLDSYLAALQAVEIENLNRSEQLAFWLNLHNAIVVRIILDHPIVSSPDQIRSRGLFARGPWDAALLSVGGRRLSVRGLKRDVLRPGFRDPRWHYGLCEATIGGPALTLRPFVGATVDRALDDAAIAFVSSPRAVALEGDAQLLNALWRRHETDFGGDLGAVLAHIRLYAPLSLRQALSVDRETRWIDDRRLNEAI